MTSTLSLAHTSESKTCDVRTTRHERRVRVRKRERGNVMGRGGKESEKREI